jgi:hypothetical protein
MTTQEGLFKNEEELKQRAAAWIEEKLPERMQSVGVTEDDVREQLEIEADNWVKWNLQRQKEGKPGTDSPDAGTEGEHDIKVDTPW